LLLGPALTGQIDVEVVLAAEAHLDAGPELGVERFLDRLLRVDLTARVRWRGVRLAGRHLAVLRRLRALGVVLALLRPAVLVAALGLRRAVALVRVGRSAGDVVDGVTYRVLLLARRRVGGRVV